MNSPVEQIKERLSISDVISTYVKLERAGSNMKGRCPFHNERTASFFVSPERGTYHCFGCGKGGDIFSFIQDIEGLTFPEALHNLADRAGVTLDKFEKTEKNKNDFLYKSLEYSTKFFQDQLAKNDEAKKYLSDRGLNDETIQKFRVGFAPDGWRNLTDFLLSKGFREKTLEEAGLFVPSPKGGYDKFRGRIMFPISDSQGRVVAFTGRILESIVPTKVGSPTEVGPKYMNSPETALYNKSKILFGYDVAKQAIMKADECIVVEGQMDLLMVHQAGNQNVVAVSGTALSADHLKLIKRFTEHLLFCFDSDDAGFKALERAITIAFQEDMDVLAVQLSKGTDPADLIKEDKGKWQKALTDKKPFITFYLDSLTEKNLPERDFMQEVTKKILPYIHFIKSPVSQAYYFKKISEKLNLSEEAVRKEFQNIKLDLPQQSSSSLTPIGSVQKDTITSKINGILLWQTTLSEPDIDIAAVKSRLEKVVEMTYDELTSNLPRGTPKDLVFEAELYYKDKKDLAKEIDELLENLEIEILEKKFTTLTKRITELEKLNDTKDIDKYLKECQEISKRINDIKSSRYNKV